LHQLALIGFIAVEFKTGQIKKGWAKPPFGRGIYHLTNPCLCVFDTSCQRAVRQPFRLVLWGQLAHGLFHALYQLSVHHTHLALLPILQNLVTPPSLAARKKLAAVRIPATIFIPRPPTGAQ